MTVPYWVQDAIFYQIFPDRFSNGDSSNDPPNVQPWGSTPSVTGFQGGDLRGIIQRFDYLLELGVTAVYLNPIFQATSNHRYNTYDYYRIDPLLGDMADFKALINLAHHNDVRIILDGVFNHCGRGFFAFNDVLENQDKSSYRDWYHISHFPVDGYGPGHAHDYKAWWKFKSLPKFNTDNPKARAFLLGVARYWILQGADGWRLDVPNEIDDDSFWAEFRRVVRSANPEAYLVGEIWEDVPRWVGEHHFDGLMNYPLRTAILGFLNKSITPTQFMSRIERLLEIYPRENVYAMYLPLGSHDTERLGTVLENDAQKVRQAFTIQFSYPGVPAVYYGDEVGLEGGKDPECRKAFPWDPVHWNAELRGHVQKLISLRKRLPVLRRGQLKRVYVEDGRGLVAFARLLGEERLLVLINASPTRRQVHLPMQMVGWPDGRIVRDLIAGSESIVSGDTLTLSVDPWGAMWVQ